MSWCTLLQKVSHGGDTYSRLKEQGFAKNSAIYSPFRNRCPPDLTFYAKMYVHHDILIATSRLLIVIQDGIVQPRLRIYVAR